MDGEWDVLFRNMTKWGSPGITLLSGLSRSGGVSASVTTSCQGCFSSHGCAIDIMSHCKFCLFNSRKNSPTVRTESFEHPEKPFWAVDFYILPRRFSMLQKLSIISSAPFLVVQIFTFARQIPQIFRGAMCNSSNYNYQLSPLSVFNF